MIGIADLPALNATLNATAAAFLIAGYVQIRRGHRKNHERCMLAAFLASYVVYHAQAGSRPVGGEGAIRIVYFVILGTHIPLAALIVPLALVTAGRGLRSQFDRHVRIARWTLPLWLYVSVTGVLIYLMLYHMA